MSRYPVDDPYLDPASGVLKNRLGITDAATLEETEAALAATELFKKLAAQKHLAGLAPAAFSERAAYYFGEVNALHPFREGNGRARANGYYIAWENVKPYETHGPDS